MSTSPAIPTQRRMRAAIRREHADAVASMSPDTYADAVDWYRTHRERIAAWAADRGVPMPTACAAAACVSPGVDPASEPRRLSWVDDVRRRGDVDRDVLAATRPHGLGVPRGYAPHVRAAETLSGVRPMPADDVKTGNYARAILDPADRRWVAIDVWAYRTTCGDPLDDTSRELPGFRAGEYAEIRRAWVAVADELGLTPSGLQAVCWVYRRGRA